MKIILSKKCPNCGSKERKRLIGMGFWENLPGARKYECEECQTDYLVFWGMFYFVLLYGKFVKQRRKSKVLVIAGFVVKYAIIIAIAYFLFMNASRIKRRVLRILRGPNNTEMQYYIEKTREKTMTTTTDPEIKNQIMELYRKAENQIIEKKLLLPKGDNAWETYNEILQLDPNWNTNAVEGLRLVKEEEKRRRREDEISEQMQVYQIQKDQLVRQHLKDTKGELEKRSEESKHIVEERTKEREKKIEEEKRRQAELELEQQFNQLIEDFWFSIDLSWERIFAEYLGKERLLKQDVAKVFELEEVNCDNTPLRNLEPLSYLQNLKRLSVSRTGIYSLQPLRKLDKLEFLDISHNNIRSLESLSDLKNLLELNCSHNEIELLDPIKSNTKMQKLNIANTKITSLNRINTFRELTELNFNFTKVSSLADVNTKKLEHLGMARTKITDISLLAHQKNLTYLDCSHTQISEIFSLENLTKLTYLDLSYTLINSIRPLRNLTNLEIFKVSGTTIDNISFIENMTKLRELHCNTFYLTGLESFAKLVHLEYVLVNRNTHTQAFEKAHPTVKIEKRF